MKWSTIAKKLGYVLCMLGAFSAVFLFWQLMAISSTPGPAEVGWLLYTNVACLIILPITGVYLIRLSVTLMLRCQ